MERLRGITENEAAMPLNAHHANWEWRKAEKVNSAEARLSTTKRAGEVSIKPFEHSLFFWSEVTV